jgi:hypothetical protein
MEWFGFINIKEVRMDGCSGQRDRAEWGAPHFSRAGSMTAAD